MSIYVPKYGQGELPHKREFKWMASVPERPQAGDHKRCSYNDMMWLARSSIAGATLVVVLETGEQYE